MIRNSFVSSCRRDGQLQLENGFVVRTHTLHLNVYLFIVCVYLNQEVCTFRGSFFLVYCL